MPQRALAICGWLTTALICTLRLASVLAGLFCVAACRGMKKNRNSAYRTRRWSIGLCSDYTIGTMKRPSYLWKLRSRSLELGARTLVMGILNVTPDSFSDGGRFLSRDHAVGHALQMFDEGADILDIGGESTRPGSKVAESGVSADEELLRIMPVIQDILLERPDVVLSVDTYKAEVAHAAVAAGVQIVNDVSALRWHPRMAQTVVGLQCGVVLMHTRGRPEEWGTLPPSPDIVDEVKTDFMQWTKIAIAAGVEKQRIVIDPGFGFGKKFEGNYPLLAGLSQFHELGFPLL